MKKLLITVSLFLLSSLVVAEAPSSKTITETFSDWQLVCIEKGKNKQCEVKQMLSDKAGNVVAVLTVGKSKANKKIFQITLPHLLDLTQSVTLFIDEKNFTKLPFNFCNNSACFVISEDNKILSAFRGGSSGHIQVKLFGAKEYLNMNFSLKGFSAALKRFKLTSV